MQMSASRRVAFGPAGHRCTRSRVTLRVRAEAIPIPKEFTKVSPTGDRVLVKVADQEVKTRGGIFIPTVAQKRPTSGDVISLGDGRVGDDVRPFHLKAGDTVLYSKFGFMYQDITLGEDEYILIRESDVIGIMPSSNATAEDIVELKPVGDRLLVKVEDTADVTMGGVILPDSAKERPLIGTVVRTGPGKWDPKSGEADKIKKPTLKEGDKVLYFKYAGDAMETPAGDKYVVLREDDVLCRA